MAFKMTCIYLNLSYNSYNLSIYLSNFKKSKRRSAKGQTLIEIKLKVKRMVKVVKT